MFIFSLPQQNLKPPSQRHLQHQMPAHNKCILNEAILFFTELTNNVIEVTKRIQLGPWMAHPLLASSSDLIRGWREESARPRGHAYSLAANCLPSGPQCGPLPKVWPYRGKNMAPPLYTPKLKGWPKSGHLQKR